jgi:hypothetical protein
MRKVLEAFISAFRAWFKDVREERLVLRLVPREPQCLAVTRVPRARIALFLAVVQDGHTVVDERPCHGILDKALVCGQALELRLILRVSQGRTP